MRPGAPVGPRRWSPLLALAAAALACSTLADTPDPEECRSDADCADTYVCAVDQGRCLPGNEAAPRAHLGFDIRERTAGDIGFRVEIDGCDCTVEEEENIRELSLRRSLVSQTFVLAAEVVEDPDGSDVLVPLPARFELSQPSRHHHEPITSVTDHPTFVEDDMTQKQIDTELQWQRYHPLDERVPSDLVLWEIRPRKSDEELVGLASRFLPLRPPRTDRSRPCEVDSDCCEPKGDCNPAPNFCDTTVNECTAVGPANWTYDYVYDRSCSRGIVGNVITPDPTAQGMGIGLPGATVSMRHADLEVLGEVERLGIPVFGSERPVTCESDDGCAGPDEYCNLTAGECYVALAGRAANGGSTTDAVGGFIAPVFTYCSSESPSVTRRYAVTVQPEGPRPTVEYLLDIPFTLDDYTLTSRLCVPDWGEAGTLQLALEGQPRALAGQGGEYTCCDVGCLPATADDAAAGPPMPPEVCDGRTSAGVAPSLTLESHLVMDQATRDAWEAAECLMPFEDAESRAGSLVVTASCSEPTDSGASCLVGGMALGTAEEPRRYTVRFESEPGSVLASADFEVELGPTAPPVQTLTLPPRVLVTGVVDVDMAVCARRPAGGDCAAREAVVLAERLRLPDEPEGSVPGPYFHSVTTVYDPVAQRDGAFVLPLDPGGVYVLTALPLAGAEGGPADFTLVDLRGDTEVEPKRLVLEDGVVVTLRLEQFDQRTTVIPLDRGSYRTAENSLQLPELAGTAEIIDLDEVGACWTNPKDPQACRIRRLIPPGYDLARSQVGVVRFTARRSNEAQCSVRCPMSDPAE